MTVENNPFAGFGGHEPSTHRAPFLEPGFGYDVQITKAEYFKARETGSQFVALEFNLLSVEEGCGMSVGKPARWMQKMSVKPAKGAVMSVVCAATGESHKDVSDEDLFACFGEGNPLAGRKLHIETNTIQKKDGGDFTVHTFSAFEGE